MKSENKNRLPRVAHLPKDESNDAHSTFVV